MSLPEGGKHFSADEMMTLLAEVDELLHASGSMGARLVAAGGASMLSRVPGRLTGDIDIISEGMSSELRSICAVVAEKHGLAPDWINDGAKGFAVSVELEPQRLFTGRCLVVDSVGPRYLLAMKLLSGRRRDQDDTVHLIREVGISQAEELLDLMESAVGRRTLTAQHEYRAREWFAAAHRWHRLRSLRRWVTATFRRS